MCACCGVVSNITLSQVLAVTCTPNLMVPSLPCRCCIWFPQLGDLLDRGAQGHPQLQGLPVWQDTGRNSQGVWHCITCSDSQGQAPACSHLQNSCRLHLAPCSKYNTGVHLELPAPSKDLLFKATGQLQPDTAWLLPTHLLESVQVGLNLHMWSQCIGTTCSHSSDCCAAGRQC